jgi:hypothetical protein
MDVRWEYPDAVCAGRWQVMKRGANNAFVVATAICGELALAVKVATPETGFVPSKSEPVQVQER